MFAVMHNTVLDHFKEKPQNESDLTEKEQQRMAKAEQRKSRSYDQDEFGLHQVANSFR